MKTIYYYQSFVGLEKALENITDIDVIIVSSIHFGKNGQQPYIHLNDNDPVLLHQTQQLYLCFAGITPQS